MAAKVVHVCLPGSEEPQSLWRWTHVQPSSSPDLEQSEIYLNIYQINNQLKIWY